MKILSIILILAALSACGGGNATQDEIDEHDARQFPPVNCSVTPEKCK